MKIQAYLNGVLTGIIIGLLFAPESGMETRRKLSRRFNNLRNTVNDAYLDSKEAVRNELEDLTNSAKTEVKEGVVQIKDNVQGASDRNI